MLNNFLLPKNITLNKKQLTGILIKGKNQNWVIMMSFDDMYNGELRPKQGCVEAVQFR